jgi:hypothetical protein
VDREGAEGRTATSAKRQDPRPTTVSRFLPPPKGPRRGRVRRQNRLLAFLLGSVAALGFATVLSLAVLLHYAEAHHLLAGL